MTRAAPGKSEWQRAYEESRVPCVEEPIDESLTRSPPKPQSMSAKRIFGEMFVTFVESSGFDKFSK